MLQSSWVTPAGWRYELLMWLLSCQFFSRAEGLSLTLSATEA